MFYFKQMEIDPTVNAELFHWSKENMQKNDQPFVLLDAEKFKKDCNNFMQWAKDNNLEVLLVVGIKVNPFNGQDATRVPHIDLMDESRNIALNFPIENCDETYTKMYRLVEGDQIDIKLPDGTLYSRFSDNSKFEEVAKFYLNKPTFFNTSVPHQVYNDTDKNRLSLSIRFKKNPELD